MALETGTYISDLVATNPTGSDPLAFADDHIRLVKSTIKSTFPNISGAVTKTHTEINALPSIDTVATAIAAAIAAAKEALYPVGSIYTNASSSTNPSSLLGFGTWAVFGEGRVLVGQNAADASFDVLEETGGSKDTIAVAHTHTFSATTSTGGEHSHSVALMGVVGTSLGAARSTDAFRENTSTGSAGSHNHTVSGTTDSTGSSGTNANLQPYVVVKMWKRTA